MHPIGSGQCRSAGVSSSILRAAWGYSNDYMVTTTLDPSSSTPLAQAEASARAVRWAAHALTATCWISAALFLVLGTYYFTKFYWGPAILARIGL